VIDEEMLDRLMAQVDEEGLELLGPDGVLTELTSRIMNRALEVEMADHLGYEKGDPAGWGSGNNRNGAYPKTVLTDAGGIPIEVPRDREGTFKPALVPIRQRRIAGFNDLVIGLVARGMTVRDVQAHIADVYRVEISPELVSRITDAVLPELREWQSRPLDPVYPILYLDAVVIKVRTDGRVRNRPVYVALAVDLDGRKHVLGLWLGSGDEGAKFWLAVLTELRNRGVSDVLIACCDGLTGFGDAIEAVWPETVVQTSLVHHGQARNGFGCHPHRRERTSADRPGRSGRRPVPSVDDGLRTAIRSCAASAKTSDGGGLSRRMSRPRGRTTHGNIRRHRLGRSSPSSRSR
jgi:transposase-like protein